MLVVGLEALSNLEWNPKKPDWGPTSIGEGNTVKTLSAEGGGL